MLIYKIFKPVEEHFSWPRHEEAGGEYHQKHYPENRTRSHEITEDTEIEQFQVISPVHPPDLPQVLCNQVFYSVSSVAG